MAVTPAIFHPWLPSHSLLWVQTVCPHKAGKAVNEEPANWCVSPDLLRNHKHRHLGSASRRVEGLQSPWDFQHVD